MHPYEKWCSAGRKNAKVISLIKMWEYDGFDNKMFWIEKLSFSFADDWFKTVPRGLELTTRNVEGDV
jgi:hypothetical protein